MIRAFDMPLLNKMITGYLKAGKKEKGSCLNEYCKLTGS